MNPPSEIAIRVKSLSKSFRLPHDRKTSIKSSLINFHKRGYEIQEALKNVSFEVKKGEFFGIVGRNGSGKSTLLKTLAGIYAPSTGSIEINGSLVPFIELGVGFNPELTGRENVYLNGALLGFSRKQMNVMYKDIVEFAELEKFMDQKLKNYSSGMQVRLAFSIAIRAKGDILLLDEVLAVGDAAFQQKCYDYFNALKKEKRTIILVSHNMQVIEQYCDRALLIEQSQVKKIGPSPEIASMYDNMFLREEALRLKKEREAEANSPVSAERVRIKSLKFYQGGKEVSELKAKQDFEVEVSVVSSEDFPKADIGINIKNRDRIMVVSTDVQYAAGKTIALTKGKPFAVRFKIQNILTNGTYTVNLGVGDYYDVPRMLLRSENAGSFMIHGRDQHVKSLAHPRVEVKL